MTKEEYDKKIAAGWKPGPSCPKCKKQHLRLKLKRSCGFEVETEGCKYVGPLPLPGGDAKVAHDTEHLLASP